MAMLIVQCAFVAMYLVMVHIVQPFDPQVHAGLIGEIPESVHVIPIRLIAQILTVNHPMCVLVVSLRIQLQLSVYQYISIWRWQKIAACRVKGLFAHAHSFKQ